MIAIGVSALPFDDPAGFTAPAAFGPFRVLHQIGSGVLGPVFRTFDPRQEKLVAVKVFRLDVVPEVSARLADVLKRLATLAVDHPAVVPLIDAGLEGTNAFLAMDYVAAETLDVSLRRLAPAGIETAMPILRQIAQALEAAWSAGVGHGALHPRDIFVLPAIAEGAHGGVEIRVSGFGVTEALQELQIPTPVRHPYTAPERDNPGRWDMRADVYSLGVIAHELLTGRRPSSSLEQDGDDRIRRALAKAIAQDPKGRFDTPMAFVDALTTSALPKAAAGTPMLPWPGEPDPVASSEDDDETETGTEGEAGEFDAESQLEAVAEPKVGPEPQSIWVPGPGPEKEPARPTSREAFHPFIEPPKESAMPRILGVAVIALAVGTGFGYWLRGPEPAPPPATDVLTPPSVTTVPADEPIGTDVAVSAAPARQPPAKAPVSEAVATRGRLLVRSVPGGATVSIDGRESGTTPATIRDLAFGTYTVAVSRSGYQRREQRITISRAVPAREVTMEMPASSTTGSVLVETRPTGATVSIDGKVMGTAPMRVPELSAGSHTVRVSLAGHKTLTTTVVVRAGQQTPLKLSLEIQ